MSWRRLLAAGVAAAFAAGLIGIAIELWRFGPTTASAARRVEAAVRADFDRMNASLSRVATRIASDPAAAKVLEPGVDAQRALFDVVARARNGPDANDDISVTVYDAKVKPAARAWGGRPSEIPEDRIAQPATFFVKPSPLGLRLVYVHPIVGPEGRRLGTVAAEHVLSPAPAAATITPRAYVISTPLAPASLRMRWEGAGDRERPGAFVLRAPDGSALVEASVAESDLQAARVEYRERTGAIVLACFGVTMLLLIGVLLDRRAAATQGRVVVRTTSLALALLALGTLLLWLAFVLDARQPPATPVTLLLAGFVAAASVALLAGPVTRLRIAARPERRAPAEAPGRLARPPRAAGVVRATLYVLFARQHAGAVDPVTVDLRHFSLHPWSLSRVMLLTGILAFHSAILWAAVLEVAAA